MATNMATATGASRRRPDVRGMLVRRRSRGKAPNANRRWLSRGALAAGLATLGFVDICDSFANVVVKVDPARAYALARDNGAIAAAYAEASFSRSLNADAGSAAGKVARSALLSDPTAVGALTVLGMQAQLRGDSDASDRIFRYSNALSRREFRPRIWAIEKAVSRGDVRDALHNYDIALRTSNKASAILFPTLAGALAEPRVRAELLDIISSQPYWRQNFFDYVALSGDDPAGAIAFFKDAEARGLQPTQANRANLVTNLAFKNQHESAWDYYRRLRPGARRDRSRDPEFALQDEVRAEFDWQPGADPRVAAAILRDGTRSLLDLSVAPGVSGEALSQTELLPPGLYSFEGRSSGLDLPERSQPYWILACQDGRELGRIALGKGNRGDGRHSGRFIVPQGCSVQRLSLMIRPVDSITGVSGQILRAQLVPVR